VTILQKLTGVEGVQRVNKAGDMAITTTREQAVNLAGAAMAQHTYRCGVHVRGGQTRKSTTSSSLLDSTALLTHTHEAWQLKVDRVRASIHSHDVDGLLAQQVSELDELTDEVSFAFERTCCPDDAVAVLKKVRALEEIAKASKLKCTNVDGKNLACRSLVYFPLCTIALLKLSYLDPLQGHFDQLDPSSITGHHHDLAQAKALWAEVHAWNDEMRCDLQKRFIGRYAFAVLVGALLQQEPKLHVVCRMFYKNKDDIDGNKTEQEMRDTQSYRYRPPYTPYPPLFLVGDSHVLTYAWRSVRVQHVARSDAPSWKYRTCVPWLVTGLKAWHIQTSTKAATIYNTTPTTTITTTTTTTTTVTTNSTIATNTTSAAATTTAATATPLPGPHPIRAHLVQALSYISEYYDKSIPHDQDRQHDEDNTSTTTTTTTATTTKSTAPLDVLISCGEIDVREGIGGALDKGKYTKISTNTNTHNVDSTGSTEFERLCAATRHTVTAFLDGLQELGRRLNLRLILLPVAPHASRPAKRGRWRMRARRRDTVKLFNAFVHEHMDQFSPSHVVFLDYSSALYDEDKAALDPKFDCDKTHLNAKVLTVLENALLAFYQKEGSSTRDLQGSDLM
jgi:hypothetical protein